MSPEEIVKKGINNRGLKISFVADKIGMNSTTLSKSLRGNRAFKPRELIKICVLLGLSIEDFKGVIDTA